MSSKKEFSTVVYDERSKARAIHIIKNMKVVEGVPVEVIVKPYKSTRSKDQNALYWKWVTLMADDLGNTKDELHEELKRMFLVPIIEREDEGFADTMKHLRAAYKDGHTELTQALHLKFVMQLSTSALNVNQMTEYLESVLNHAQGLDISLPLPERKRMR